MKKIILISCVKKKLNQKAKTKELYISSLFKKSFKYAQLLKPDNIFILSAKYGLLDLDKEIEPYEETLNNKSPNEIRNWAIKVIVQLKERLNLNKDEVIIFAGKNYYKFLLPYIKNYRLPLEGLSLGNRMKFLNKKIKEYE